MSSPNVSVVSVVHEIRLEPLISDEKEIIINIIDNEKNNIYKITLPLGVLKYCKNCRELLDSIDKNDTITLTDGIDKNDNTLLNCIYYIYGCYRVKMKISNMEFNVELN